MEMSFTGSHVTSLTAKEGYNVGTQGSEIPVITADGYLVEGQSRRYVEVIPLTSTHLNGVAQVIYTLPAKHALEDIFVEVVTPETVAATPTIGVGTDATPNEFLDTAPVGVAAYYQASLAGTPKTRGSLLREDTNGTGALSRKAHCATVATPVYVKSSAAFAASVSVRLIIHVARHA